MGLGSEIRKRPNPDPGSRGQKGTGSQIRIRNTGMHSWAAFGTIFSFTRSFRNNFGATGKLKQSGKRFSGYIIFHKSSVADPDPGSGAFLTPGSGIRIRSLPDLGSQTHTFKSLVTIF
jgi:hypothetical protein